MNVQEIFSTPAIREVEMEILQLQYEVEKKYLYRERNGVAIEHLLSVRKTLLDRMFVFDEESKALITDFNDALSGQLKVMRHRVIDLLSAVGPSIQADEDVVCVGKYFLGYEYSKIHPVQTMRAKKMWAMLNGTMDSFMPIYDDGVIGEYRALWNGSEVVCDSENHMLFLEEE